MQLNIFKVNDHEFTVHSSHQRRYRGDGKAMVERLLQTGNVICFHLFPEGGNLCCTVYIVRKVIPNFMSIEDKTMTKSV